MCIKYVNFEMTADRKEWKSVPNTKVWCEKDYKIRGHKYFISKVCLSIFFDTYYSKLIDGFWRYLIDSMKGFFQDRE